MRLHAADSFGAGGGGSILGGHIILIAGELLEIRSMIEGVGSGLRVAKVVWSILCM